MSNFFKNPIVHGVSVFVVMLLSLFLNSGSPLITMTVGGAAAAIIAWFTAVLG